MLMHKIVRRLTEIMNAPFVGILSGLLVLEKAFEQVTAQTRIRVQECWPGGENHINSVHVLNSESKKDADGCWVNQLTPSLEISSEKAAARIRTQNSQCRRSRSHLS